MIDVRIMNRDDLPLLSEYWYDQIVLYQQTHRHIKLMPDARLHWQSSIATMLEEPATCAYTCVIQEQVIGALIGRILPNDPGLLPESYGFVQYLLIDLHTEYRQMQIVQHLLEPFVAFLQKNGLHSFGVDIPVRALVEQGFWRGAGAQKISERFWMIL
jgi:hypothetical protein